MNRATSLAGLNAQINDDFAGLSKRLSQIGRFLIDNPDDIAFGTVAVIAEEAGVHPSALVRFAHKFGFSGFSEMQQLFQNDLVQKVPSYQERIKLSQQLALTPEKAELAGSTAEDNTLLNQFVSSNMQALAHLSDCVVDADVQTAINLLLQANTTYIVGVRRAFIVANYFAYSLQHIDRHVYLVDGAGGMFNQQVNAITEQDVLIAVSFYPYADETQQVVDRAKTKNSKLIVITDSLVSPYAQIADVCFVVKEAEVNGFRSLTSSLCLAQSLSIGLAYRLEN
ncbi:MurR/RpiR family transcriptional regulator [Gammaproteobacteria bacterium AS21]